MYQSSSGGYGNSGGYGMFKSLSNSSPISYGAMKVQQSYGGGGSGGAIQSYLADAKPTTHESYQHFSQLETVLEDVKPTKAVMYNSNAYKGLYLSNKKNYFPTDAFLAPSRPETPVIQEAGDIMPYIEEAFEKLVGSPFPKEMVKVHILDDKAFEKAHGPGGKFGPGIQGFALNRQGRGVSEVFVRKNHLDRMMLTLGHEIGHVMSPTLSNERDEEAKAFAFSLAWMKAIKKHNIAGIGSYVVPEPARNGLHDVAFEYLLDLIQEGKDALQLFKEIAKGMLSITKRIEVIYR